MKKTFKILARTVTVMCVFLALAACAPPPSAPPAEPASTGETSIVTDSVTPTEVAPVATADPVATEMVTPTVPAIADPITPTEAITGVLAPNWCKTHMKLDPDISSLGTKGRSYWAFVMNFDVFQGRNPVGCLVAFEPNEKTPAFYVPVTSCRTNSGRITYTNERAEFQDSSLKCDANIKELIDGALSSFASLNITFNVSLEPTYVYTNFSMVVSGTVGREFFTGHTPSTITLVQYIPVLKEGEVSKATAESEAGTPITLNDTVAFSILKEEEIPSRDVAMSTRISTAASPGPVYFPWADSLASSPIISFDLTSQIHEGILNHYLGIKINSNPKDPTDTWTQPPPINFGLDGGTFFIGGGPNSEPFNGSIDEIIVDPTGGSKGGGTGS